MINNIEKKDDIFNVGFIESKLFNRKMEVWIENTVDIDYAEKCVNNFQLLSNETIDKICERISAYHKFMLEEWNEEFVAEINEKVPCEVSGRNILKYIENPSIFIFPPEGEGIGYIIDGKCEWEPEHGISIILLDNKIIDVGPTEGLTPWSDKDEFERLF